MNLGDVRLAWLLEKLIDRKLEVFARNRLPQTKIGIVAEPPSNGKVSVFLDGQTEPSPGFAFTGSEPVPGQRVRVHIGPRGDRYVDAILGRVLRSIYFNVKDFGAVGDGIADDTSAIRAAVAAAVAAGGGVVFFPPGIYLISATITAGVHVSLLGSGAFTTTIQSTAPVRAIDYPATLAGPSDFTYNGYFTIRDLQIRHAGSGAALRIATGDEFHLGNIRVSGEDGATGNGVELIDCFSATLTDVKIRSFTNGSCILFNTNTINTGGIVCTRLTVSTALRGYEFTGTASVNDTMDFIGCGATNCTIAAIHYNGASVRNHTWIGVHLELTNDVNNTATGILQGGTDCQNLSFVGLFLWGMQAPGNFAGTIQGLSIRGIYANINGHTAPAALITTSAQVNRFELGVVQNAGYLAIADSSDANTRRKIFAGALPTESQLGVAQALTNAAADLGAVSLTATPVFQERWIVDVTVDMSITVAGAGLCTVTIVFDGANQRSTFVDPANGTGRFSVHARKVISGVTPAAHTVKVQVSKANAGGTATAIAASSVMTLDRVGE